MTIKRYEIGAHKSDAVEHGGVVYVSGITASDRSQDTGGQVREILAKIDTILANAGTDKSKILSANIWLTDVADFKALNDVWIPWLAPGHPPARACVQAALAAPGVKVEIAMIVAK